MFRFLLASTVALALGASSAAQAADWYTGAATQAERDAWIVAVDASATVSSQGSQFASGTVTAAPLSSLEVSGPRLRFDGLIGTYRIGAGDGRSVRGEQQEVAAMAGYAWVVPNAVLAGYVGANLRHNAESNPDGGPGTNKDRIGVKAALDYYARPTSFTMFHATGNYSTAFSSYYGRVRGGWSSWANGYIGPEFALLGDDFYRQWRAGIHLSGMDVGPLQIGVSAGYLQDQSSRGGIYATLDLRTGF